MDSIIRPDGPNLLLAGEFGPAAGELRAALSPYGLRAAPSDPPDTLLVGHIGNEAKATVGGAPLDRPRLLALFDSMTDTTTGRTRGGNAVLLTDADAQVNVGADPHAQAQRAADLAWWQYQARRLADRGLRLNTIMVGYAPVLGHGLEPVRAAELMQFRLVRRACSLDDIVAAVRLLASAGPAHTIGEVIPLDGGIESLLVPPAPAAELAVGFTPPPEPDRPHDPFTLNGLRVLVTGASSGIGRATAVECARRGASLILVGRRRTALAETADEISARYGSVGVDCLVADLQEPQQVPEWIEGAWQVFDGIDALVYSAGVLEFDGKGDNATVRCRSNAVNYLSYAAVCDGLLARWIPQRRQGTIAAVASVSARWAPVARTQAYGASKAAMLQHTRMTATSGARYGIRANAVLPGIIDTPMADSNANDDRFHKSHIGQIPQGRIGLPDEVAALLCYLISSASGQVSGAALRADGGGSLGCLPDLTAPRRNEDEKR